MYRDLDCFHAHSCDDKRPIIAPMGKGPKGNSVELEITDTATQDETYISGYEIDEQTGQRTKVFDSPNINGGKLTCEKIFHPETDPETFVLKFTYTRPGRDPWVVETPYIPYASTPPGPIPAPVDLESLAFITGLSEEILHNIIVGATNQIESPVRTGLKASNIFEYINKLTINPGHLLTLTGNRLDVNLTYATEDEIDDMIDRIFS